ncbi:Putative cell wall binding repeat-containing protein [Lachnospiraceae bacterium NE2001]|nr:Putative cell wall binding repeat-containing protein [Lachnospiraceae bacterium NE2001]
MKYALSKLNKGIIAVFLAALMIVGIISAPQMIISSFAIGETFDVGCLKYKVLTDDTVEVSKNLRTSKNIVIPKTVSYGGKEYTVTGIGHMAFSEQAWDDDEIVMPIESVVIPDSITSIEGAAFECCKNLTSISIPDSVTTLKNDAFYFCINLSSVKLSKNLTSLEDRTFCGCCSLGSITIPNGVTKIGDETFYGCDKFTCIEIPDSVEEINESAFNSCDNLEEIIASKDAKFILKDDRVIELTSFTIDSPHGTIELTGTQTTKDRFDKNICVYWDTVKVLVTPDEGYELESLTVTDNENDTTIIITENSFIDSYFDFTIKATYKALTDQNTNNGNESGSNNGINNGTNTGNSNGNSGANTENENNGTNTGNDTGNDDTSTGDGNINNGDANSVNNNGADNGSNNGSTSAIYSSEWVNGKWYNADGSQTYEPTMSWKSNGSGWWMEDTSGWYPVSQWQKIDGYWYYFNASGYMASDEWVGGYYLSGSGALTYNHTASWYSDSNGWYYKDTSGWYPTSQWAKINSNWYYFNNNGYMVTSQYIDGYWIDSNGVCK